jgi:lysophospholipase L1-like esterase
VALGDSYTIGTGLADVAQNFPSLLASRLREETGIDVTLVNLGVNGYTTADLIREELPVVRGLRPELVTILIGANDVVQGSDEAAYRTRLAEIYDAVAALGLSAKRVLALSIPDFSSLPGAAPFGSASELRARVDAFNAIAESEVASRGFGYTDITGISRKDHPGDDWLAGDGLHPGPAQHRAFADRIWETAGMWQSVAFDRWSNSARQVLKRAEEEAETMHHSYIGTEHLLLGLLRDTEGAGGKLLSSWRVSYQRVRKLIDGVLGKRKEKAASSRTIPTTRVRTVLRIASQEASAARAEVVGTEDVLLALMLEGEGIAAHVLSDLGVTSVLIRTAIGRRNGNAEGVSPPQRGPWSRLIARLLRKPKRANPDARH